MLDATLAAPLRLRLILILHTERGFGSAGQACAIPTPDIHDMRRRRRPAPCAALHTHHPLLRQAAMRAGARRLMKTLTPQLPRRAAEPISLTRR